MEENKFTLPKDSFPINYKLLFEPNFENFTFFGKAEIELSFLKNTKRITLNSSEIKINESTIKLSQNIFNSLEYDTKNETLTFIFENDNEENSNVVLSFEYSGILNDKLAGFYRTSFIKNGKVDYHATTQFEATGIFLLLKKIRC
jgi:hypothetical protein